MNSFTLLYLFYGAKLGSQASIYFIWLKDSSSETIAFIAATVAVLAIVPFFHVIVNVFSAKPFSNSVFIAYLCFSFLLAILWYKPTQDGEQRVLPFALVTIFDLLALFIFLFKKQISHWHDILTSDIEQGRLRAGSVDDISVTFVGQGNEQAEHRDFGGRPDTPESEMRRIQVMQNPRSVVGWSGGPAGGCRGFSQILDGDKTSRRFAGSEMAMRDPSNVGWGNTMVQSVMDLELGQKQRSEFFIDLGADIGDNSGSAPVGGPATIYSNMHPALRPTFDDNSRPGSPDGFQMPKQAPSPTRMGALEQNQI